VAPLCPHPELAAKHWCNNIQTLHQMSFPFLRLPKDIRFMVYDLLKPGSKYVRLSQNYQPFCDPDCAILVIRSLDLAILATCRTINEEAKAILHKATREMLSKCALQILLPTPATVETTEDLLVLFLVAVHEHRKRLGNRYGTSENQDE
jgi:hypothetical protein